MRVFVLVLSTTIVCACTGSSTNGDGDVADASAEVDSGDVVVDTRTDVEEALGEDVTEDPARDADDVDDDGTADTTEDADTSDADDTSDVQDATDMQDATDVQDATEDADTADVHDTTEDADTSDADDTIEDAEDANDAPDVDAGPPPGSLVTDAPYACACDGTTNDTVCLQAALDDSTNWSDRTLRFPEGVTCVALGLEWYDVVGTSDAPYVIDGYGATLLAPAGAPAYGAESWVLDIATSEHLRVEDLRVDGNRDTRTLMGEFIDDGSGGTLFNNSYNIRISASADIELLRVEMVDAAMDNLLIRGLNASGPTPADFSRRIRVVDSIMRRGYRNNVSVINCDECVFVGDGNGAASTCQITDANGTLPEAGIDFEPNASSPIPGITNSRVEGCYIARNEGRCLQLDAVGEPDGTVVRGNLFEDCRRNTATCGSAILLGHSNALIEGNTFRNFTLGDVCRSLFDAGSFDSDATLSATLRNNVIQDIAGVPTNGQIVYFHRFNAGGHRFEDNELRNIGVGSSGDWCSDFGQGLPNIVEDNTIDDVLQSPNPGCP